MPKFAANLSMMFQELEPAERFGAARGAGFRAVEYLAPYRHPIDDLRQWLAEVGVDLILINSPSGNSDAGERGLAALPGREADFRDSFDLTMEYATRLGVPMVHLMAGVVADGESVEAYEATFVANLRRAAEVAKAHGVMILLEALNTRDSPGYLHTTTALSRRLIEAAGGDNVFLQYDLYHMQIMQGDLVGGLQRHLDLIKHIQFSSVPGRHEPQYGEVNLPFVFDAIDASGYARWVGCEYRPLAGTLEGLSWGHPYGLGKAT